MRQTILIIDDDENDIFLTERTLQKIDPEIRVKPALSGEAGLTFLRDGKELPVLVLLDLKMPGMSGFDTLREIRSDERLKNVPVVVLTSSTLRSDMELAYEEGANNVFHKSVGDQFRKDLESVLKLLLR